MLMRKHFNGMYMQKNISESGPGGHVSRHNISDRP